MKYDDEDFEEITEEELESQNERRRPTLSDRINEVRETKNNIDNIRDRINKSKGRNNASKVSGEEEIPSEKPGSFSNGNNNQSLSSNLKNEAGNLSNGSKAGDLAKTAKEASANADVAKGIGAASKGAATGGAAATGSAAATTTAAAASTTTATAGAAGAASAAGAGAAATATGAVAATPVGWIILLIILGIFLLVFLIIFFKYTVFESVNTKYSISNDELLTEYEDVVDIETVEQMDEAFGNQTFWQKIADFFTVDSSEQRAKKLVKGAIDDLQNRMNKGISSSSANYVKVKPGYIIASLLTVYYDKVQEEINMNCTTEECFEELESVNSDMEIRMLYDYLGQKNDINYDEMFSSLYFHYNYTRYDYVDGTCKENVTDRYAEDPKKFELLLRYGKEVSSSYEEYNNYLLAIKSTNDNCMGYISNKYSEEEINKFLNNINQKAVYKYEELISNNQPNYDYQISITQGNNASSRVFSYKTGFVYTHMDAYNNSSYTYNTYQTPVDIENIITEIYSKQEDVNSILGYDPSVLISANGSFVGTGVLGSYSESMFPAGGSQCAHWVNVRALQVLDNEGDALYAQIRHNAAAIWFRNLELKDKGFVSGQGTAASPKPGSIAVFAMRPTQRSKCSDAWSIKYNNGGCGHVLFVEDVLSDGKVVLSECNYNSKESCRIVTFDSEEAFESKYPNFLGYIYLLG